MWYILRGKEPVEASMAEYAAMEKGNPLWRQLAEDVFGDEEIRVSTVFLGLDHNHSQEGPPILFETMIFGGEHDQSQWRYWTFDEALQGHRWSVELVGQTVNLPITSCKRSDGTAGASGPPLSTTRRLRLHRE